MRVSEMRRREDFDQILRKTLVRGWKEQYGVEYHISSVPEKSGQQWYYHPIFSVFAVGRPDQDVRHYLRDSFRFTPLRHRLPAQWLLGTICATASGFRLTKKPSFSISPSLPDGDTKLILPGNQRIRVFDFADQRVRVFLKDGFSATTMETELRTRIGPDAPPTIPILAQADDGTWFEEPIVRGFALPRCPPWFNTDALCRNALSQLDAWSRPQRKEANLQTYLDQLQKKITSSINDILAINTPTLALQIRDSLDVLLTIAYAGNELILAPTHGDLQAGNILVGPSAKKVMVIDWEHSAIRSALYDRLVFGLGSRSAAGLSKRILRFINGADDHPALEGISQVSEIRRYHVAIFLLEDLWWFLRESACDGHHTISRGLYLFNDALLSLRSDPLFLR